MHKVKILITAAGMGKRFGALTKQKNKSLMTIEGKPLIIDIISKFRAVRLTDISIITGFQAKQIENAVKGLAKTIYNPFFAVSGILGSFWAARHNFKSSGFIFTTSDHLFTSDLLRKLAQSKGDLCILVEKKKSYTKEDAKVIITRNRVLQMGKDIPVKEAHGEFGGMAYFSKRASKYFFDELKAHFQHHGLNGYMMELMVRVSQKHNMPIKYLICEEQSRIEIDSVHDLIAARKIASNFKNKGKVK